MWNLNYDSITQIDGILRENGLAMSKKFGQNFLVSARMREGIADLVEAEDGMAVWEIGPGLGAITSEMLKRKARVTAFEIDHGFAEILRNRAFSDEEGFTLVEGDALKTLFTRKMDACRIIGNLPYNVGSQIIARLIEASYLPDRMVFTLQREVCDRIVAKPGDEDYSSFSVLTNIDYSTRIAMSIRRGCFWPQPNVDSAVVVMERKRSAVSDDARPMMLRLVRSAFAQRRKTLRNNLSSSSFSSLAGKDAIEGVFSRMGLTGSERAETLSVERLAEMASYLAAICVAKE